MPSYPPGLCNSSNCTLDPLREEDSTMEQQVQLSPTQLFTEQVTRIWIAKLQLWTSYNQLLHSLAQHTNQQLSVYALSHALSHTHTHIYTVHGNHIFSTLFTPLCLAICIGIACLYLSCSGLLPIICNTPLPTLCGAFLAFLFSLIDVVYLLVLLGARGKRVAVRFFTGRHSSGSSPKVGCLCSLYIQLYKYCGISNRMRLLASLRSRCSAIMHAGFVQITWSARDWIPFFFPFSAPLPKPT